MKIIATNQDDSRSRMRAFLTQEKRKRGKAIDPYFYRSDIVYQEELGALLFKSWIYAAHVSEVPKSGDYVLFEIGEESIIIVRDKNHEIHALMNVCRHRGARLCEATSGNRTTFVCPYHRWTYSTDGSLRSARHMEMREGFDKADYPLKRASVAIYMGLIFINCDPHAADPLGPFSHLDAQLGAYELEKAKVAHQNTYKIPANWKLCLENYLECYHCAGAHPAYAKRHTFQDLSANVAADVSAMLQRAPELTGVPGIEKEHERIYLDAESFGACAEASRYGLYEGFLTGSEDGQPVAPLMGKIKGYDGGAGDFQVGPVTFMLNYPDHCVLYRFVPRGLTDTDAQVVWFVNGDAEEGRDYDLGKLTWLWHQTTQEDQFIITRNSKGVNSNFFEPGPYHPEFEATLQKFVAWYLDTLERAVAAPAQ